MRSYQCMKVDTLHWADTMTDWLLDPSPYHVLKLPIFYKHLQEGLNNSYGNW